MEETRKFVCKFCNKRFPSGKSLGGHIRTHMNQHSSNKAIADSRKLESNDVDDAERKKRRKRDLSSSDYGLRENPRKTKRFVHNHPFFTLHHKEKFCRECGKGFSSLKALCGHMACHTEKVEKQKFATMDEAQSDAETSDPDDLKRTRFMTLNNNNPTSSASGVEQEEEGVEEVATCLILLSKGFYSHKGRFDLDKESNSDNYSAILAGKAKSHSVDARIGVDDAQNKVKNSVYNASEIVKVGKDKMKLKFSDSGYSRYGSKKEDSNVSIHGVFRNDVFNRPKVEDGYGFKDYDDVFDEPRKMMINNRCYRSRNDESKKLVLGNSDKFDYSFNSAKQEYPGNNLDDQVSYKKKKKTSFPNHEVYNKDSYDSESSYASAEKSTDSTDSDSFPCSYQKPKSSNKAKKKVMKKSKKTKEHECPICNRTFRSGQALGGHKRSHFVGGFEENNNSGLIVRQESLSPSGSPSPSPAPAVVPCLIDLNLPAPPDE
ncbi:uncharacterized protein LOC114758707 [Neltuma alba]|uniref:uncharacterized protein LOC114756943 n=1 Tax=Neltuma alba TaxID=207710 RepID=UPI0010A3B94B|nr:uncharacterized protein LOC114756943 [Prosopis alba]XP_028803615.1 uncharacterized protein LOC114758704 [Prosopis alba]XP_028803622.1 uncharacterized protein LOC114758707 [Prosopis alba]